MNRFRFFQRSFQNGCVWKGVVLSFLWACPLKAWQGSSPYASENSHACESSAFQIEQEEGIPHGLLSAITLVESGVKRDRALQAWPWTVQSKGQSYYFSSKAAAMAAVRRLMAQGERNIDVGCAQVNLGHHPRAFRDLHEAFDPYANVRYAASFLKKLAQKNQSWDVAVAHYHSANAEYHVPYKNKVYKFWNKERKKQPLDQARYTGSRPHGFLGQGRSVSLYLSPVPSLVPDASRRTSAHPVTPKEKKKIWNLDAAPKVRHVKLLWGAKRQKTQASAS